MKAAMRLVLGGSVAVLLLGAAPAWADQKIGVVNFNELLQESPDTKAVQDRLRSEFQPRQRELQSLAQQLKAREDKLQKDGATMTDDQRAKESREISDSERELQRKQNELQEDANARQNQELSALQKTIIQQVQAYARSQNFDLVIPDSALVYANPSMDVTPQVLAALQARAPKPAAPAPAPAPAGK